jgi:chromosome segregation ATPase
MKLATSAALASLLLMVSCVSVSDYRQLENDFASYKESMQTRQAKLEEDMKIFKMGYDPNARQVFEYNVKQAGNYYAEIVSIRNEIDSIGDTLARFKTEAESAKNTVLENARTSQSQNVVNEFYFLRRQWESTLNDMNKLVLLAQQSVSKAQSAASESYDRAVQAEKAAKTVSDVAKSVNDALNSLNAISQRLSGLEQAMVLVKKDDVDTQKSLDDIALKLKAILARIDALEKKVGLGSSSGN